MTSHGRIGVTFSDRWKADYYRGSREARVSYSRDSQRLASSDRLAQQMIQCKACPFRLARAGEPLGHQADRIAEDHNRLAEDHNRNRILQWKNIRQ